MGTAVDINRLWVHVSCFGDGNLFAVYPRLLAKMMAGFQDSSHGPPDFDFLLPSNEDWRTMIYYQLVEKQKQLDENGDGMAKPSNFIDRPRTAGEWDTTIPQPPTKKQRYCKLKMRKSASHVSPNVRSLVTPVTWTVGDIVKAAYILSDPPVHTEFKDEQEMRRVYTLIYDVFRYRNILNQVLNDTQFFVLFPEENFSLHHLWLLLYDLYHRHFRERETADGSAKEADLLFPACKLTQPDAALWATRVRLAAAMSRLRIAHSALRLSDMLPPHLRDERVAKAAIYANVTCWVNKNKIGKKTPEQFLEDIKEKFKLNTLPKGSMKLTPEYCRWDPLCPMFLTFHHSKREALAQSPYVQENIIMLQNLSFCYGPAIFCKLLFQHNLTGAVVQSHINSPRATAYFATLLTENDQIFTLFAFGAGQRKEEYENYFKQMNIKNVKVFEQRFNEIDPESSILAQVVGVYATPPNSYSAINDPVDLVCSRGGDLAMLEVLTDTAETEEGQKRVQSILEEQRLTLRFAMTQPQIQFVLYETHSMLNAENNDMVTQVMKEVNRAAKYKHAELQGKLSNLTMKTEVTVTDSSTSIELQEINNNDDSCNKFSQPTVLQVSDSEFDMSIDNSDSLNQTQHDSEENLDNFKTLDEILSETKIPETDEFKLENIPDLCFNCDQCLRLEEEGCFLALLERKEVTRFDAKYMIKIAEARGLFGDTDPDLMKKQQKTPRQRRREVNSANNIKRKRGSFEVERIAAPTHASVMRSAARCKTATEYGVLACCPKHHPDNNKLKDSPAKLWWAETTRYLTLMKKSLIRQKVIANDREPKMLTALDSATKNQKIMNDIKNIDELLGCVERNKKVGTNIPFCPKLRLTRQQVKVEKKPFPIFIKNVHLPWDDRLQ